MKFEAAKLKVANRGVAPDSFLDFIVEWAKREEDSVFAFNANPADIYAMIETKLSPWHDLTHRKAAMLEVMRVHAGLESSWNWNEAADKNNPASQKHIVEEETGIFQVSFNSTWLQHGAMQEFARNNGIGTPYLFIPAMKQNHELAIRYYARLVRINIQWAGPLKRGEVTALLDHNAVDEFRQALITP